MGEVYRADDLKLGQPVALKFLPPSLALDRDRLDRLFAEVRVGRQVSHPNVCRLYDVVEADGNHFVAMEYVDGEDLAALLRRIGHLPVDKALEIARDVGAGLAAAHDRGVIHRDLKPANVMVDGHGRARITDFGLAVVMEQGDDAGLAGTPAYMAPEQLGGAPATVRSDLYALGLVFYEMFTGRRRFEAASVPDLIAQHRESRPLGLSSSVRGLPPAVERVIARCLEEDPAARPPSAHAVIAALPVGDALQAAIDAGETPSPAMVAAAGKVGDLAPAVAWTLLGATVAGMLLAAALAGRTALIRRVPLPKPPEVLKERGREVARRLGHREAPVGTAGLFTWDNAYVRWIGSHDPSPSRWDGLARRRPAPISFYYIQSPRELEAANEERRVVPDDPPLTLPGMVEVVLDPDGALTAFTAVPPQQEELKGPPPDPDWASLFGEASLDPTLLRPVPSSWAAPVDSDRKAAWDGTYPGQPDVPMHVEAAAYHGKPVWFSVLGPWSGGLRADRMQVARAAPRAWSFFLVAIIIAEVGGVLLAIRNLRRGRGDRRGAWRLAVFTFLAWLVAALVRADHVADLTAEWELLTTLAARGLFVAALVWVLYVALEPYVRRRWPQALISWNRLLAGRLRDAMVGRDLLFGATFAVFLVVVGAVIGFVLPALLGRNPLSPRVQVISTLNSVRHVVWALIRFLPVAAVQALVTFCLLLFFRVLLRRDALAVAGLAAVCFAYAFSIVSRGESMILEAGVSAIFATLTVAFTIRAGLLALACACYVSGVLSSVPLTLDLSSWYSDRTVVTLLVLAAVAVYGFYTSLGGKPLFGASLLED